MGNNLNKALLLSIIILFCTVFLLGCTNPPQTPTKTTFTATQTNNISARNVLVMSYPDSSLDQLVRVTRAHKLDRSLSLAESTVYALLAGLGADGLFVPFGGSAYLISVQVSRDLVVVDIGADVSLLSEKELFSSIVSLTNTLTELTDINYVKLSINGVNFLSTGILINPLVRQSENLYLSYLEHQDYVNSSTGFKVSLSPNYVLYFVDYSNQFLLTEIRTSYQSSNNLALDLLTELKNGPATASEMQSPIPKNVVLQSDPQIHIDDKFGNILTISFEAPKHITINNESRYMMAASIVNTIQNNMPEINGVRILINSQPAISTSLMRVSDFEDRLGNLVTLYYPNSDMSYLVPIKRVMSQGSYKQIEERLLELMSGLLASDSDSATNIFPIGISDKDIIAVNMQYDTVSIDFSQNLINSISLNATTESLFIYSIVNTLAEFNHIKRVQILIEGKEIESLGGNISINQPLLPNPGIIQK
ncbi:MAG: GerMN domain-containing protein [Clostridiales bacterium]|nr:GerMN domain-containing protein [Clostridiales bacterium]